MDLVSDADCLNRSIPTYGEVVRALLKLGQNGLVEQEGEKFYVTTYGCKIFENARNRRGGLFSIAQNTVKALNSPRFHHPYQDEGLDLTFLTEEVFQRSCQEYLEMANPS